MKMNEIKDFRDPSFNPPTVQKVNKIEEGNFFVPSGDIQPEMEIPEAGLNWSKVFSLAFLGLVAAAVLLIGISILKDPSVIKWNPPL